ncbi:fumarylacetoacetate hydrolase family protein [Phaeobacter sp.]|uniref:fumarylacetoacetate hydrolase family protein n=1 Tax=Phaeobacter sp. TaxID=1902409 RepID=UPI0025E67645|nr:fumarylacetoacetate hydrolase family protein [Phaeobacter sp.]
MIPPLFDLPPNPIIPVVGMGSGFPVGRIFCVGRNYAAHAAEMGVDVDRERPFYFTKSASHAVLSGAELPYPRGTENFHHEIELAVALGAPLDDLTDAAIQSAIFGYCTALDMTRRDLQLRERQKQRPWSLGKDLEGGAVFAPITSAAEWTPTDDTHIWLNVNGDQRQTARLGDLVWSITDLIRHLSGYYRLQAGDVLLTGTPAGVGPVIAGDTLTGGINGLSDIALTITNSA